ncbi:hypothetical protein [Faecalibacillus intestinalis]|uniref:hypothetical protein n=1 Tax=Faecalibacillus intestinalis TaxID=1982626 RepID=UPI0022E4E37A|nr:hypothetical protein [Faecalibacillus intestinalis]
MDRVVDMTIKIVNERTDVEVFSYNKMKNIFKGYVDSLPQEILNMDIKTFNIKDNTLILNVEE